MKRPAHRRPRRSRRRRLTRALWLLTALAIGLHFALPALTHAFHRRDVRAAGFGLLVLATAFVVHRVRRWLRVRARLRRAEVSERRRDYVIEDADFTRHNAKEGAYRRLMQLNLLATFGNACAKCGARDDGVDLDHFFWPKSEGGCFIMRHADGYLVNNAIPLCVHCNRSKSDRSYRGFFKAEQLAIVLEKNARMTRLLNERPPVDARGDVRARVRRAAA